MKYLAELANIDLTNISGLARTAIQRKEITDFVNTVEKNKPEMDLCTIYNIEEEIKWLNDHRTSFFPDMGYSKELLDYFEVGGEWVDYWGIVREAIAIRDSKGILVGFDGRRKDGKDDDKYHVQPEGLKKENILYHYHKAKEWITTFGGRLFVVEGYKACWSMVNYGWLNTIACLGSRLYYGPQSEILFSNLEIKEIIFMLDGDIAGRNGARSSARMLQNVFNTKIIDFEDGKDPSNMNQEEIQTAIEQVVYAKEQEKEVKNDTTI
jgi:5S rRNA maturation endonuclease (ribonuclease M5)